MKQPDRSLPIKRIQITSLTAGRRGLHPDLGYESRTFCEVDRIKEDG